jgi:hypothetical protein
MLNHTYLRIVREVYLLALRNGLNPNRARYHAARKAKSLGVEDVHRYVNLVHTLVTEEEAQ